MQLWELEEGEELTTLPGDGFSFSTAAFSPDGRFLMSQNSSGALHLWSAPSWEEINAAEAKDKKDLKENIK